MTKYHYSLWDNSDIHSIKLTPQVFLGMFKIFLLITIAIFARQIYRIIYNLLVCRNQKFTDDIKLIEFIQKYRSNFKNSYGFYYQKHGCILESELIQAELDTQEYQDFIERSLLVKKVSELFYRYLKDWNDKNFDAISDYTLRPFSLAQKK